MEIKTANLVIKSNAGTVTIPLKGTATITPKVTFVTNKAEGDSFMLSVAMQRMIFLRCGLTGITMV